MALFEINEIPKEPETIRVNLRKDEYDIRIARPSPFGNPYTHIADRKTGAQYVVSSRSEAIKKYKEWILGQPKLLARLPELKGKRIACYCKKNEACHGDVLIELIKEFGV